MANHTRTFFILEEEAQWTKTLEDLSRLNLPIKTIADHFGCSYQRISTDDKVMSIIRSGWAAYRCAIEQELYLIATANPYDEEDPIARSELRKHKLTALKTLHAVLHKEPFVTPAETERIRRLTDEELQVELQKHVKTTVL